MTASIEDISKELCDFISSNILASGVPLLAETPLGNIGVDSFSTIEIVLFIERRFGVIIPDEQLTPENMRTVSALAKCAFEVGKHQN